MYLIVRLQHRLSVESNNVLVSKYERGARESPAERRAQPSAEPDFARAAQKMMAEKRAYIGQSLR
jgi:hypothetical protein